MGAFLRQHTGAVLLSVVLHGVLMGALVYAARFTERTPVARQIAIEATVVDESVIQREIERLEALETEELRRQQEQERLAREQAEAARRELEAEQERLEAARRRQEEEQQQREEAARQEQARIAELQRQREEEERLAREEEARREEAERQRLEEEARLARVREEEEQRRREEEEQRRREAEEAAQRAALEAELQRALAAEEERREAEEAGLLDEYIRLIENRIQQNWIRPASAVAGLECVVNVTQIPSGDVIDVRIGRCNGDDAVLRSIEAAVLRASPLPKPPIPALFERNLQVIFHPEA